MKTILVFCDAYVPGFKGGGPIRSISSIVELLGDEFAFKIITRDHDTGEKEPYKGIIPDTWCKVGKAEVYYASKESLRLCKMVKLINSCNHDILYLNSFFSPNFSIKPILLRFLKIIPSVGTILAPRGEFSQGAIKLKRSKKQLFIHFAKVLGLYKNILWQASSEFEKKDITNIFTSGNSSLPVQIVVAPDLACQTLKNATITKRTKQPGQLDIVFLSRISPMKNLDGALSMLNGIQGNITFNIFGPVEDKNYLQTCQSVWTDLGNNVKVHFYGEVNHDLVADIFSSYHLFFFPTHGENFGHVILEALLAGCPVLLSDQTPWKNLESFGIGWDLPLERPERFRTVLDHCVAMDNDEFAGISRRAIDHGKGVLSHSSSLEQNRMLFHSATAANRLQ